MQKRGQGRHIGCRTAAETSHEVARLPAEHELLSVDVGERSDTKPRLTDQLCKDSAWAEGDEWPEDGILDHACQELRTAAHHRLHEHLAPDARNRLSHLLLVREGEDNRPTLGLVRTG